MSRKRLYEAANGLWVVGDYDNVPSGLAYLRNHGDGTISVFVVDINAPLIRVNITDIESDDTGTSYYDSLTGLKSACKTLFQNS